MVLSIWRASARTDSLLLDVDPAVLTGVALPLAADQYGRRCLMGQRAHSTRPDASPIIATDCPGLLVACPYCGAEPWKPCRTKSGRLRLRGMHAARRQAAPGGPYVLR
jgi:hypothetical protein